MSINNGVFAGCSNLTKIIIPDNVMNIDGYAFCNCKRLTNVTIPDSVMSIGEYAFSECSNLKEINFKGIKKQAIQLGIGNQAKKKWRTNSPIQKIVCTDGVIEL